MLWQAKLIQYGLTAAFIISICSYTIYKFHYQPINKLTAQISYKDETIKAYEKEISNMYSNLYNCEQNLSKNKLDGIIEGLGGEDEEDIIIDFSNITY